MDEFAHELGPTIDDLVDIARSAGIQSASRRTIRNWVSRGHVFSPRQKARQWRYPNMAIGQVDTVARFRARRVHSDFLRFALYVETGAGDPAESKRFVLQFLDGWEQALAEHRKRFGGDLVALRAEAETEAKKRGQNAVVPRIVRQSQDDRTLVFVYTLAKVFSMSLPANEQLEGQRQLERLVGLRAGRGGATRDLQGFAVAADDWPTDPTVLRSAVRAATPERLEFARRRVELAVAWFPALRASFGNLASGVAAGAALVDTIEAWEELFTPEKYPLLFAVIVRDDARKASDDDVRQALSELRPEFIAALLLTALPEIERATTVRRLRPYQRLRLATMLAKEASEVR